MELLFGHTELETDRWTDRRGNWNSYLDIKWLKLAKYMDSISRPTLLRMKKKNPSAMHTFKITNSFRALFFAMHFFCTFWHPLSPLCNTKCTVLHTKGNFVRFDKKGWNREKKPTFWILKIIMNNLSKLHSTFQKRVDIYTVCS